MKSKRNGFWKISMFVLLFAVLAFVSIGCANMLNKLWSFCAIVRYLLSPQRSRVCRAKFILSSW
ncbi:MAG: hypothetical protein CHKLHMKO_00224 [Candidatus Argoarchaeum ethanivorans]|uniref:Lipoprotein n=1 Tax=Candidatus Argoarchaeum ethanivorans TaxID=2608793 RepID=A0A811T9B1_9EURY|nr:MAG: hypothetical protein CHKLHMKO_00224 [Candidatus Argoarchaeum ethanivorans]